MAIFKERPQCPSSYNSTVFFCCFSISMCAQCLFLYTEFEMMLEARVKEIGPLASAAGTSKIDLLDKTRGTVVRCVE